MLTGWLLLALTGQEVQPTPAPPKVKDKERTICRSEGTTGSRLGGRRVCHTREEWDMIAANARKDVEDAASRMTTAQGN
ncbi:hypothetical protein [Sphingomonas sp. SORGH_AS_0879]|uniref:hypothetical protein n=1 Tax=Sphingomonas sp. SORGH_AS_0879 TaxID=3041790 RepID=UPI0027826CAF|nr:hypothetical protein [Sphingomonas sp. SORGH_AS_0879]MDQ1229219.1 hypothetical protein [Sphingomonas sp. SORGH_AS_0879]